MRSTFNVSPDKPEISMDFTYSYMDDPDNELLTGNITWNIPDFGQPGHWVHVETPCKCSFVTLYVRYKQYLSPKKTKQKKNLVKKKRFVEYSEKCTILGPCSHA